MVTALFLPEFSRSVGQRWWPHHDVIPGDDDVDDFKEYYVGMDLKLYVTPLILVVGIVGNALSILVATSPRSRRLPFNIYLCSLAFWDILFLLVELAEWLMFVFLSHKVTVNCCYWLMFLFHFTTNQSAYSLVALTSERFLSVCAPITGKKWRTPKVARNIILLITAVNVMQNVSYFYTTEFYYDVTHDHAYCATGLERSHLAVAIMTISEFVFSSIIPFVVIAILNTIIVLRLRQRMDFRRRFAPSTSLALQSPPQQQEPPARRRALRATPTMMLLSVSFSFLVLSAPLWAFRTIFVFVETQVTAHLQAQYILWNNVLLLVFTLNHALNFYMYCLSGPGFRRDLCNIFEKFVPDWVCEEQRPGLGSTSVSSLSSTNKSESLPDSPCPARKESVIGTSISFIEA